MMTMTRFSSLLESRRYVFELWESQKELGNGFPPFLPHFLSAVSLERLLRDVRGHQSIRLHIYFTSKRGRPIASTSTTSRWFLSFTVVNVEESVASDPVFFSFWPRYSRICLPDPTYYIYTVLRPYTYACLPTSTTYGTLNVNSAWWFAAGGGGGTQSLAKRLHHHAANYDGESSNAGQQTARPPTVAVADFTEEDYPSDFRWPESYFDLEASSDVAVVVGQTAFLVCRVAVAGNWTVSNHFPTVYMFFHDSTTSCHFLSIKFESYRRQMRRLKSWMKCAKN